MQVENATEFGVVTNIMIPKHTKSMDMRLWRLRCRTNQQQFRPCCSSGKGNYADYTSNHHSAQHHVGQRPLQAGLRSAFDCD